LVRATAVGKNFKLWEKKTQLVFAHQIEADAAVTIDILRAWSSQPLRTIERNKEPRN